MLKKKKQTRQYDSKTYAEWFEEYLKLKFELSNLENFPSQSTDGESLKEEEHVCFLSEELLNAINALRYNGYSAKNDNIISFPICAN